MRQHNATYGLVVVMLAALALGACTNVLRPKPEVVLPEPEIVLPESGSIESDITLILAKQRNERLASAIRATRFEYSTDGVTWIEISTVTDSPLDLGSEDLGTWNARLDTRLLTSGEYVLRVTMETFDGQTGSSMPVTIRVNKVPFVSAKASPGYERGSVLFNATGSEDPDGRISSWRWDYGDGSTGSGLTVEHVYADLSRTYEVLLTVVDNLQTISTGFFLISFPEFIPLLLEAPGGCTCKGVTLRGDNKDLPGEKAALGEDGVSDPGGDEDWQDLPDAHDGKTLGPLDVNPGNTRRLNGEMVSTGYAFEVVFDVDGDPILCKEIQVVKRTTTAPGIGADDKPWTGRTADLDLDGTDDIDIPNRPTGTTFKEKCERAGDRWIQDATDPTDENKGKCRLEFPQSGSKYGPDTMGDTAPEGAYEREYTYKKHSPANGKIIWWDAPSFDVLFPPLVPAPRPLPNGTTSKGDFIALVRGSDDNYCYVAFTYDVERKVGQDKEELTETDKNVGVASVPGLP